MMRPGRQTGRNGGGPGRRIAPPRALWLAALLWLGGVGGVLAQADTVQAGGARPAAPAAIPDALEITSRLRAVTDSAGLALRQIAALTDTVAIAAELERARERQEDLRVLSTGLGGAEFVRADRIARVRNRAIQEDARLATLDERTTERLGELGQIRTEWAARQRFWREWEAALRDDPEFALFQDAMREAAARVTAVREEVVAGVPALLEVQREIQSLRLSTGEIAEASGAVLAGRRAALLQRDQPALPSAAFREQLREAGAADWRPEAAVRDAAYLDFVRERTALLAVHALLVLLLGLIARRLRRRAAITAGWAAVLRHPWAAALFASTALVAQRYALAPPLVEVAAWTVLAGAGVVLARLLVTSPALRRMVYSFSLFYPLFLLAEALWLPPAVFQLGLAVFAALGLGYFVLLAGRARRAEVDPGYAPWIIAFGGTMWVAVLLAESVGFHRLSRWVIHAAVTSALIVFVVAFLVVVARGLIWTLLNVEVRERFRAVHSVSVSLAERVLRLVQVVLVIAAVLTLLNVWELTPSPLETWGAITSAGFMVAGAEVTIGRILFAILLVYLALLVSWVVRTIVSSEVVPRWDLDRGVGDSITAVIHYLAIAVGILVALGALGVHLQNIAIVAGALSVGIGFGLQNVVNNFVSGIILLFERPVRVGDTVVIGGEWGTIRKIGLRSTRVETFDRSEMIVPNGDLVSEKVTNWTLSNPVARLTIPIGVAYGSPVRKVKQILRDCAFAHPAVLDDPEPMVLFVGFGESALDFELRVWVRELRHRLDVQSVVLEELDTRFRAEGIEIPFPQRDLHLRSVDPAILPGRSAHGGEGGDTRPPPPAG